MNKEIIKFLTRIAQWGGVVTAADLDLEKTKAQDNARRQAKRAGLAQFVDGRWWLTEAGYGAIGRRKPA